MPKKKSGMSAEHKAALAKGRAQSKAVRDYLRMLEQDGRRSSTSVLLEHPEIVADRL